MLALGLVVMGVVVVVGAMVGFLSPAQLVGTLGEAETLFALRMSLWSSALGAGWAVALGVPAGYFLARRSFWGKQLVEGIVDLPLVMPPLVAGMGLVLVFGASGVGRALARAGIEVAFSPLGVVVAQGFVALFVVVRVAKAAFEAVEPIYEAAAQTLGLSPGRVFLWVTLPMAGRGLLSAAVLGWARAMGEFGATLMLAGATRGYTETLPMAVFLNISSGRPEVAVGCGLVLLGLGAGLLVLLRAGAGSVGGGERWVGSGLRG